MRMDALRSLGASKRRTVSLSNEDLVRIRPLFEDRDLPLLVEPAAAGLDLVPWAAMNSALLEERLHRHGGILFRGFNLQEAADLERFIQAFSGESLEYR